MESQNDKVSYEKNAMINPEKVKKDIMKIVLKEFERDSELKLVLETFLAKEISEKEIFQFLNKFDFFQIDTFHKDNFLLQYNIFNLWGNTLSYKNKIIVFIGNSNNGKTTLSQRLAKDKDVKLLAEDFTLSFYKDGKIYICESRGKDKLNLDYTRILKENNHELDFLLYVDVGQRKFDNNIPREALKEYLLWFCHHKTPYSKNIESAVELFSQIPSYRYARGLDNNVEKAYRVLRKNLDKIIDESDGSKKPIKNLSRTQNE